MVDAYNILCRARNAINDCSCGNESSYWKNEEGKERQRANNLVEKSNDLVDRYNEISREYKQNIKDYNELVGRSREMTGRYESLQERYEDLSRRFNRLNDENRELRENHEEEKRRLNGDVLMLSRTEERLREEGAGLRRQVAERDQRLLDVGNEKNELAISLRESNQELTGIRIENSTRGEQLKNIQDKLLEVTNERDERITPLDLQELTQALFSKDEKIERLEKDLSQSKEQSLEQRIRAEENKLEKMANRLKIDWEIVKILQDNYEELVRVRNNFDRDRLRACQDAIEVIRQGIIGDNIDIDEVQDLAERCENLAKLRIQVENHYQAQTEILV
jgi:chromosome segregation ATPase